MKASFPVSGSIGFALASVFALREGWSLPEFCWSTWISALVYVWACVAVGVVRVMLLGAGGRAQLLERYPALRAIPSGLALLGWVGAGLLAGYLAIFAYNTLFGFYGVFLSVFAEMQPHSLFGRNGFINSDFFTPVSHLLTHFWPMALGTLVARWQDLFFGQSSWRSILLPMGGELLRIHLLTLALPFAALLAWALFGSEYQPVTILLLMALLYFLPRKPLGSTQALQPDATSPNP